MKRLAAAALVLTLMTGCAPDPMSMVSQLAGNPMISSLSSSLGLNAQQAVGGAGALLGLGKANLPKADWTKIADAIPGANDMVKTASSLGGITGKVGGLGDLTSAFGKIGLSQDQVTKMVPAVTDYVGKAAGQDAATALAGVLK